LTPPGQEPAPFSLFTLSFTPSRTENYYPAASRGEYDPERFNVECYDRELATALTDMVRAKMEQPRSVGMADVDGRSLPIKLRDGASILSVPLRHRARPGGPPPAKTPDRIPSAR